MGINYIAHCHNLSFYEFELSGLNIGRGLYGHIVLGTERRPVEARGATTCPRLRHSTLQLFDLKF